MPVSDSDLLLLGRYDTPTISNVIELFEVRPRREGFMDKRIRDKMLREQAQPVSQ